MKAQEKKGEKKMITLTMIQIGRKFKVYHDQNGKRILLGIFKSADEAISFMNRAWRIENILVEY